jgi:hypothetical protein
MQRPTILSTLCRFPLASTLTVGPSIERLRLIDLVVREYLRRSFRQWRHSITANQSQIGVTAKGYSRPGVDAHHIEFAARKPTFIPGAGSRMVGFTSGPSTGTSFSRVPHMSQRARVVGILIGSSGGFILGVIATILFASRFYGYGNEARLMSDATVDLAVLDKLTARDLETAQKILSIRLEGTMIGLKAARSKLTQSQARQLSDLETRATNYVTIAKP